MRDARLAMLLFWGFRALSSQNVRPSTTTRISVKIIVSSRREELAMR